MKIDTYKRAGKYRLILPLLPFISLIFVVFAFIEGGQSAQIYLAITAVFMIIYLFLILRKPHYFYFETKHNTVIVRFYNPHIGFTKPRAYQIAISNFAGFSVKKSLLSKSIIFKIKKGKKTGDYPPVSISLLNKGELVRIKEELNTIIKMNKFK